MDIVCLQSSSHLKTNADELVPEQGMDIVCLQFFSHLKINADELVRKKLARNSCKRPLCKGVFVIEIDKNHAKSSLPFQS